MVSILLIIGFIKGRAYLVPVIGVVLLNWHEDELTRNCLNSLRQQGHVKVEVVLIENESQGTNSSEEMEGVRVIHNERNLGFSKAVNQGLRLLAASKPDAFLLLNNDVLLETRDTLSILYARLAGEPLAGAVAPHVVCMDKPDNLLHTWGLRNWLLAADWTGSGKRVTEVAEACEADMLNAACLLIRPKALSQVGLWDEAYFIYYDDMDWTWRAHCEGWKLIYEPGCRVRHAGSYTMKKRPSFSEYNLTKGRMIFMRRHGTLWQWPCFALGLTLTLLKPAISDLLRFRKPDKSFLRLTAYLDGWRLRLPPVARL